MPEYLTTKELADLLRIKERKVYDLAAAGEVPCAKVTGKLLFPTRDVEAWLAAARVGPSAERALPNVFLGSHDPLLDWALRESRCGLATYFDGSLDGLQRFAGNEGIATGLHLHAADDDSWNIAEARVHCEGMNAVLVSFATRKRGLLSAPGKTFAELGDLQGCRVVQRQPESGAQPLFRHLLSRADIDPESLDFTATVRSEADAALAVVRGEADAAFGLEALAAQYGLGFTPLIDERFDLLVHRAAWFAPPMQTFLAFCDTEAFRTKASDLAGYSVADLGTVRWNAA